MQRHLLGDEKYSLSAENNDRKKPAKTSFGKLVVWSLKFSYAI